MKQLKLNGILRRFHVIVKLLLCANYSLQIPPLNRGRKFLKCAKENDGCDFWCWADELRFCRCKAGFCKIRTSKCL
ncbi:DNA-binding protein HEXBP [Iris pallida]|uniref:DNA-binding protein HEXBP n=1 Tax=Iris pallida TaxID=29817 RepID=A0AAX6HC50_IRIPA|nr:DNA-binding protein HEXBP [Iris pallida]